MGGEGGKVVKVGGGRGWEGGGGVRVRAGRRFVFGVRVGRGTEVGIRVGLLCAKASRRMKGDGGRVCLGLERVRDGIRRIALKRVCVWV